MKEVLETKAPNKNENKITPNGQQNILVPVENNEQVEPLPEVRIKQINLKTDSKEKVYRQNGKELKIGDWYRQNGKKEKIGDWYFDYKSQDYYRWPEEPPKDHPALNGDD